MVDVSTSTTGINSTISSTASDTEIGTIKESTNGNRKRKRKRKREDDSDGTDGTDPEVWTAEEDNYLRKLCTIPEVFESWHILGTHINRTAEQCSKRWQILLTAPVDGGGGGGDKAKKNIKWTPEEDKRLLQLYLVRPKLSNKRIACKMQTRTAAQCNNRWRNHVNPILRFGTWSKEENKAIMSGRKAKMSWSNIIKTYVCLANRPNLAVKNRWHSLERVRVIAVHVNASKESMVPLEMLPSSVSSSSSAWARAVERSEPSAEFESFGDERHRKTSFREPLPVISLLNEIIGEI